MAIFIGNKIILGQVSAYREVCGGGSTPEQHLALFCLVWPTQRPNTETFLKTNEIAAPENNGLHKGGTMASDQKSKIGSGWQNIFYIVIGSVLTLILTIVTHVWLIPAQEKSLHKYELAEQKVSKLYQPILLATGYGNLSLTSDITFHKVRRTLEEYGHLADQEVIYKFIQFLKLCKFGSYSDVKELDSTWAKGPALHMPDTLIIEAFKRGDLPLMWDHGKLNEALKVEKEFQEVLSNRYEKAYKEFMNY